MIELTALRWFTIPTSKGRMTVAEIEPDQLGDETIQVRDHIVIDGTEKVIMGIEFVDHISERIANLGLILRDPD